MSLPAEDPVSYDPKTNTILINESYTEGWSNNKKDEFNLEIENWNHLNTALSGYKGQFPPTAESLDPELNKKIDKIMMSVTKELGIQRMQANGTPFSTNKNESLVTQMNQALALVMAKPPWEPAAIKLQQTIAILGYRCDVLIARGQWADAYADAECLVTFNPQDWKSHFRKGRCLKTVEKYIEAKQCFLTAKALAKIDPGSLPLIEIAIKDVERRI